MSGAPAAGSALRSALVWAVTWSYMAVALLVCLPGLWLTGNLDFTYRAARFGLRLLLRLAGVEVEVEGGEALAGPAAAGEPARVYMANHQSNLDPPILLAHLPGQIAFLTKRELFAVPLLGTVLRLGGLIAVDRANPAAAQASIAQAAAAVRAGRPFLVFPEGTRSRDGSLLPFKKGPFYLVEQAAAPVAPVRVEGTGALMPPGQWRIRAGKVRLRIGPAIAPAAWSGAAEPRAASAALVRQALE